MVARVNGSFFLGDGDNLENLTGSVGKLILSAFNLILQALCLASGCCDLSLHLLAAHVGRHCVQQRNPEGALGDSWVVKKARGREKRKQLTTKREHE